MKKLPAIAARDVWEKVTKGRAGTRWDTIVEKAEEEIKKRGNFGGIQDRSKIKDRSKGKASAKEEGEWG